MHIEDNHEQDLPEDFTPLRYTFNYVNKKPTSYHGICTECKRPTAWDENKGRYDRQCGRESCKQSFIKRFEANMMRTKGVTRISATAEGQEKMLANRKISGKYKMSDGVEKTYTGSYELNALKFMDKVMHIKSQDILCPGPILEYEFNGKKLMYITDFYYQPYNLVIEVKDGGDNPNTRNMPEYRAKQAAKEEYIIKNTNYNYLRLTNNNLEQLLSTFMELKMSLVDNSNERVINVNEMGMMAYMPVIGIERSQAIIVNYMQNNVFSGENINGYGIADNLKLDRIITRRKDGVLDGTTREFLYNCKYETYIVDISDEARKAIKENMGQFVSYEFLYETIFGKKMYTKDQIAVTEGLTPVIDTYKLLEYEQDIIKNKYEVVVPDSIRYDENGIGIIDTLEAVYITSKYTPEIILTVPEEAHEDYISRQEPYKLLLYMTKKGGFI
jgi:very-short-patch-repair endonuclease